VAVNPSSNPVSGGGIAKASLKWALFTFVNKRVSRRPEARRACHDQGESFRNERGGPNPWIVQYLGMSCGKK
jgi:hypothetical protein